MIVEQPKLAIVDVAGVRRTVNISCVIDEAHPPEACIGEWVLVHVGFAMSRINPDEAQRTMELLNQLGEVQAVVQAMHDVRTNLRRRMSSKDILDSLYPFLREHVPAPIPLDDELLHSVRLKAEDSLAVKAAFFDRHGETGRGDRKGDRQTSIVGMDGYS